jgi:hypothetical protein
MRINRKLRGYIDSLVHTFHVKRSGFILSCVLYVNQSLLTVETKRHSSPFVACVAGPQFYGGPDLQRAGCLPRRLVHFLL